MKMQIQVDVEKEAYDAGSALAGLITLVVQKKSATEIIQAELQPVLAAIGELGQLGPDYKDDKIAFINSFMLPIEKALGQLLGTSAPAAASTTAASAQ